MPFLLSSTTCSNTNPTNIGNTIEDFEYQNQECVTEYFLSTPTTTLPVSFSTPSTSTSTIDSSSDFFVVPSFTGGEIVLIYIAVIFLFLNITAIVFKGLDRIKTKKTYIGYSNSDVEIREDN